MMKEMQPLLLIVEDEAIVAMELEERLTLLNYRIAGPAATFEAALKLAEAEPPDLIVSDIRIAGAQDGIDTAQVLRDRYGVPVVFLSAHADPTTVRRALKTEPYGYLTKPFREQELHATIEMALQRHRLENALAQRERQLAEAQQLGRLGNWEWDIASNRSVWSPLLYEIFGVSPADFAENAFDRYLQCVHPEDRAQVEQELKAALESHAPAEYRYRIVRPDGEIRFIHSRSETRRDGQGRPLRMFGITQDVTERERAVAQVQEGNIRFTALFESSPDALIVVEQDGRISQANASAKQLFGYSDAEFAGKAVDRLIPQAQRMGHRKHVAGYVENPRFRRMGSGMVLPALAKDGREVPVEIALGHTRLDGKMKVIAAIRDVSERQRSEAALKESEARFRMLFEQATDGIFVLSRDGAFQDVNSSGCQLLGYSREELMQMRPGDIVAPEEREQIASGIRNMRNGETRTVERVFLRKDGSRFPAEISAKLRPDGLVQAMIRDISERKRTEEALQQSEQRLRQSQKMQAIGQLAGGIAHDFNNMLQIIRGYSDLAYRAVGPGSPVRTHLNTVLEAVENGAALTRQILTFSRGNLAQKQNVDLVPLVQKQANMLRRLIGENIELKVICTAAPLTVFADASMLQQVFLNLCVNARDAMPEGGVIEIELGTLTADAAYCAAHPEVRPGLHAAVSVSDTGTGMTAEVHERLFEPFYTTKEVGKGTGLGLFTVYGILRSHGGTISVYSKPGAGTKFRFLLPIVEAAPAAAQPAQAEYDQGGSETVLVAEDDEVVRKLVVRMLEAKGYRVVQAKDGHEAVEVFDKLRDAVGLVLLDIMMPRQSGIAAFRQIRALSPRVPVVMTTGFAGNAMDSQFIEENRLRVVRKPHMPGELLRAIREALDTATP